MTNFSKWPAAYRVRRSWDIIRHEGPAAWLRKAAARLSAVLLPEDYRRWIALYDTADAGTREKIRTDIDALRAPPTISILLPVGAEDRDRATRTIGSLREQLYPHWELCVCSVADVTAQTLDSWQAACGNDKLKVTRSTSSGWAAQAAMALASASGDLVAAIDPGDLLSLEALYWVAKEFVGHSSADLIFSDEDVIDRKGRRSDPWFKPDWNPALMLGRNACGRLAAFRRTRLEAVGGFSTAFPGAEEHECALRFTRGMSLDRIRHIPRVLYHRGIGGRARTSPPDLDAGRRVVADHLARQGLAAEVESGPKGSYRVRYRLPAPSPRISILIPTTARADLVEPCVTSLLTRTDYENYEILLLVSDATRREPRRAAVLDRLCGDRRVRGIEYPDRPFNYSAVNNFGAGQASGALLCFLNDDTEVVTPAWLAELAVRASLPQVAAASPTLYYPDGTIQHAGVVLGLKGIASHACHREPRGSFGYFGRASLEQDVSAVSAACMLVRAEAFRTVGGFDERMPTAYNDVDLCLRLRAAGWRILWAADAALVHRESASFGAHNLGGRAQQYARDVALMRERWGSALENDPFYNRNLSLAQPYRLAFPPRPVVG